MIIQKEKGGFRATVELLNSFTDKEISKIEDATQFMVETYVSDEFLMKVLDYKYTVTKYRWKGLRKIYWKEVYEGFWENEGDSQLEIYNNILAGREELDPETDNEADIFLKVDRTYNAGSLAYTYKSSKTIYIYEYTLKNKTTKFIAGTLLHEYCHKIKYGHKTGKRKKSTVPYGMATILRSF